MVKINFLICLLLMGVQGFAQNYFLIRFKDKAADQKFTLSDPQKYLSQKSLQRRAHERVSIDSTDLPVCKTYVDALEGQGLEVRYTSKWLNAALVFGDSTQVKGLDADFLGAVTYLGRAVPKIKEVFNGRATQTTPMVDAALYGSSYNQIHMMNMDQAHSQGYTGEGVLMAVFDEGFRYVNTLQAFKHLFTSNRVLDTYSFVNKSNNVYGSGTHGSKVLSCVAANMPGKVMGASYDVSLALYHTEDASAERPVEEFYYLLAAERADSLGVDIVNTSLSYRDFDDSSLDHSYEDLDGKKTIAAFAARMLARKGVVVVTSAGNTGDKSFKTIGTPADADSILTVGAVDLEERRASFSSIGPTVDGRIKPDVVALGTSMAVADLFSDGEVDMSARGTSFSAPLVAGFVAVIKQEKPELTSQELINYVKKSASFASSPNNEIGYGIPYYGTRVLADDRLDVYFDNGYLYMKKKIPILEDDIEDCSLYNPSGQLLFAGNNLDYNDGAAQLFLNQLTIGVYIARITLSGKTRSFLVIKSN